VALSLLIVVLHYSGVEDTRECVASLGRQSCGQFHVVVVDNGSIEPLGAAFAVDYPWVEVLTLAENRGWAGGNNAGIRLAARRNDDIVCLLNNDTVLPDNAVARLMQTTERLGPCILHPAIDSYGVDDQVQLDPTLPQPPGLKARAVPEQPGVFEIDFINGSCLLAPLSLFEKIGPIDERFFLLYEDADLGRRAVAAGYHCFCDTAVRIQHKESRSFGGRRTPIKTYYGVRSSLLFQEKHMADWRSRLFMLRRLVWSVWATAEAADERTRSWVRLLVWSLSDDKFARGVRMGVRDYLLRRFGRLNRRDEASLAERSEARS
jgi:GT2 family glycosyltransferase